MSDSLENICKKFMGIDESVPVRSVVDFLEKEEIYNLDSLFLINFVGKYAISLNSEKVEKYKTHKILGFKKKSGMYGDYYHIYCKIGNDYKIYISNKKITSEINNYSHEEIDLGLFSFTKKFNGCLKKPEKNKIYKDEEIITVCGKIHEKIFERNYIYFMPGDLKNYKGITYREIDFK